ncbi:Cell wall biogenesis glycosyltransferase [uncultured Defluviicoccus sp.]|uniref:Cell wall biogenesis glycosyltransferase n=1 Tax=metagenome TaxID=256318 RepID=A0A380TM28_9ZZZZ|nr:Cell wall biogenesis glycosyltransferase [uncultured Defluviicoccus sp.]
MGVPRIVAGAVGEGVRDMRHVARRDGPPITVLMSVYNGERWLDEAILSVLNQTFADFEFLIINDGSTDASLDIIQRRAWDDPRIKVIDKPNSGLADSLNVGIKQARGEWIARLDADDLCEPQRLERQYELARSEPSLVLIGAGLRQIDEQGRPGKVFRYPRSHRRLVSHLTTAKRFFAHSSAFYRTKAVRKLGGYRSRIRRAEDFDLWLRLSEVGLLACIEEPLVRIRQHAAQISHEDGARRSRLDSCIAITSYWLKRAGHLDPVTGNEADFDSFYAWFVENLKKRHALDYHGMAYQMRKNIEGKTGPLEKLVAALVALMRQPRLSSRYLCHRLFGETLSRELAKEWAGRDRQCE